LNSFQLQKSEEGAGKSYWCCRGLAFWGAHMRHTTRLTCKCQIQ